MSVTYAGVSLVHPTDDVRAWVAANIDASWLGDLPHRSWPVPGLGGSDILSFPRRDPIRLGVLSWPQGASRFATGYFLADEAGITAIRGTVESGDGSSAADLVMDDGRKFIQARMRMLPPRPLAQIDRATPALWFVPLVDQRYWWWFRSASIPPQDTWDDLFQAIAQALGDEDSAILYDDSDDEVASIYLGPTDDLISRYGALPPLLDAVAYAVGRRIVCELDGTVRALSPDGSTDRYNANVALASRLAGNEMYLP